LSFDHDADAGRITRAIVTEPIFAEHVLARTFSVSGMVDGRDRRCCAIRWPITSPFTCIATSCCGSCLMTLAVSGSSYLLRIFVWRVILGWEGMINSGASGTVGLIEAPLEFAALQPARRWSSR
jgi:hypothetical protein